MDRFTKYCILCIFGAFLFFFFFVVVHGHWMVATYTGKFRKINPEGNHILSAKLVGPNPKGVEEN